MKVDMVMPQMGESITEATVSRWLKQVGESVAQDEIILEISTDKVDSEIPSPAAGVLSEILFNEGDVVPVKVVIAKIDTAATAGSSAAPQKKNASSDKKESTAAAAPQKTSTPAPKAAAASTSGHQQQSPAISPLVRSLAGEHGVSHEELATISGSGQGGRITKNDFLAYVSTKTQPPAPRAAAAPAKSAAKAPLAPTPQMEDSVERMSTMRRAIAQHMVRSKQTSPHVYSVQEIDMTVASKWRDQFKKKFKANEGGNLTFTHLFLEAAIKAIQKFPVVNSSVGDNAIIYKKNINLGCAVALPNAGLIVPVIQRAEEKNLVGLARSLNDLATRARNKKLAPSEVQNGTFTITNVGGFGTIIGTPIINQPQVAILCIGAIKKRAVVIDDMIAIRQMCCVTLSYDHRVIDGAVGGAFLKFIREYLENWDTTRTV